MMLYIILAESNPFPDARDRLRFSKRIMDGVRPPIPRYVPEYYRNLISACWNADAKRRPTFADIIANPDALMLPTCDADSFDEYKLEVLKLP
jgi:hypothetical protein